MSWLINAAQLDKFRKNQKALIILDATWHMPSEKRDAKQEFLQKHIIDAQFLDLDIFNDTDSQAPHNKMLICDEKILSEKVSNLGIRNDYKIIFYDNSKLHTSCRALWLFKMMGHNPQQLYILDGGLDAWDKYQGKVESGGTHVAKKSYQVKLQLQYLRTLSQIKANLHNPSEQIIDVRHAVRFAGGPEDRPGLRCGHIPGSFSFPFTSLFDAEGYWKPLEKIRSLLNSIGLDLNSPIITSCGSGTTAAVMSFALDLLSHEQHAVYNGSWTEWGREKLFPHELSLDERPVENCIDN
jgi:thiosulfate/3-mercaptopyruvate sulfurtransferase